MPKLTKRLVDAATTDRASTRLFLWDSEIKGFGVMVTTAGAKSYVLQYRTREGRSRRYTMGKHGSPWTTEQARQRAMDLLRDIVAGVDPLEAKAEARIAPTIFDLADLYLAEGPSEKPNKKASSWRADRSNIERHIKPLLGRMRAKAVTPMDVAKFQQDVADGKTAADVKTGPRGRAIVEGGRGTAARSLAVLGAMLQFAVGRRLLSSNPAKGVKLIRLEPKERFLSEADVAKLAVSLQQMEASGKISQTMSVAIRLLMLTGCRKSEILALRWDEIDWQRGTLVLSTARSKTGAKRVPVAAAALELLAALPHDSLDFVLPASKGKGHIVGLQKAWEALRDRAGLPSLRLHDLRHSFASFAVADGHALFMVGKVLGHRQVRTTEGYAHLAGDPLKAVADRTAARISAAMKTGIETLGGPAAPIPKRTV